METVSIAAHSEFTKGRTVIPGFCVFVCVITDAIVVAVLVPLSAGVIVTETFCVSTISVIVFVDIAWIDSRSQIKIYFCCSRFITVVSLF